MKVPPHRSCPSPYGTRKSASVSLLLSGTVTARSGPRHPIGLSPIIHDPGGGGPAGPPGPPR
eukprot:758265-Hanusia_phi.AAC.1